MSNRVTFFLLQFFLSLYGHKLPVLCMDICYVSIVRAVLDGAVVIWMSVRTSAGIKASRIMLSCHFLVPDSAVSGWDTASPFLQCSPVLTGKGVRVGVMTELTLGHFVSEW